MALYWLYIVAYWVYIVIYWVYIVTYWVYIVALYLVYKERKGTLFTLGNRI